jgi:hypothetical protein
MRQLWLDPVEPGEAGPPKAKCEKGEAWKSAACDDEKADEDPELVEGKAPEKRQTSPAVAVA